MVIAAVFRAGYFERSARTEVKVDTESNIQPFVPLFLRYVGEQRAGGSKERVNPGQFSRCRTTSGRRKAAIVRLRDATPTGQVCLKVCSLESSQVRCIDRFPLNETTFN